MSYIRGRDTIRGTDGSVCWTIGDEEFEFIHATQVTINLEIDQDEVPRIGARTKGHKLNTVNITGSMTGYYGDPRIRAAMTDYVKGGAYPEMTLTLTNKDPDTQAITQVFTGKGVIFNNIVLAELDANTTMLEEDFDFTLENYDITTPFTTFTGEGESALKTASIQPVGEGTPIE